MADGLLPPFGEPSGTPADDSVVLDGFLRGEPASYYSDRFHVEGAALVAHGDVAIALRLGPGALLLRRDLPEGMEDVRRAVELALAGEGMALMDEETLLATPIAVQVLGLRLSTWDLWGREIEEAFVTLRSAAAGEHWDPFPGGGEPFGP